MYLKNIIENLIDKLKRKNPVIIVPDNIPSLLLPIKEYLDEEILYIYEIKRKLYNMKFKVGILSHSALLLQTIKNNYFILEYGSGKGENRNSVFMYKQNNSDNIYILQYCLINEYIWDKRPAHKINDNKTIYDAYNIMNSIMAKHKYNVYKWNCHMAQQKTRKILGSKYNLRYEYTISLLVSYIFIIIILILKNIYNIYINEINID